MTKDENFVNAGKKRKTMLTYYAQLQGTGKLLFYIPEAYLIHFTYRC
jgi:hypothetical protein